MYIPTSLRPTTEISHVLANGYHSFFFLKHQMATIDRTRAVAGAVGVLGKWVVRAVVRKSRYVRRHSRQAGRRQATSKAEIFYPIILVARIPGLLKERSDSVLQACPARFPCKYGPRPLRAGRLRGTDPPTSTPLGFQPWAVPAGFSAVRPWAENWST